jgi:hypothetical protein
MLTYYLPKILLLRVINYVTLIEVHVFCLSSFYVAITKYLRLEKNTKKGDITCFTILMVASWQKPHGCLKTQSRNGKDTNCMQQGKVRGVASF